MNVTPDERSALYGLNTDKIRHSTQYRPWWKQGRQDLRWSRNARPPAGQLRRMLPTESAHREPAS